MFTLYPAIDLRRGKVVRLEQGDPNRETIFNDSPRDAAKTWVDAGARWLHVVNLDGAFGEGDTANRFSLREVVEAAAPSGVQIQFGGGLRTLEDIETAMSLGVTRVILGTAAIETPDIVKGAIQEFGEKHIGIGIDAKDGLVRTRGWVKGTGSDSISLAKKMNAVGVSTIVFTNIARDGVGTGVDIDSTKSLAQETGLAVIASGGVSSLEDIQAVKAAGLSGVIVGRALYDGKIDIRDALAC